MPPSSRVRILNFHGLGEPIRPMDPVDEAMVWLKEADFADLLAHIARKSHVQLTFDDGNKSDVTVALPLLLAHALRATFFPIVSKIGQLGYMDECDIELLIQNGMDVGSHGMHHRSWRRLPADAAVEELSVSRRRLEEISGHPVTMAACPFGQYDRRALAQLRRAGYRKIFTSDGGWANPEKWMQPRNTVSREMMVSTVVAGMTAKPSLVKATGRRLKGTVKRWR